MFFSFEDKSKKGEQAFLFLHCYHSMLRVAWILRIPILAFYWKLIYFRIPHPAQNTLYYNLDQKYKENLQPFWSNNAVE